jgi:(R)-2-hydroxyacyl-CoA dehydratese activating ATPase
MRTAGIDVGSRTVKLAIVDDGKLVVSKKRENSFDPLAVCRQLLEGEHYDSITATGYGRHLLAEQIGADVVTEIKAAAVGARYLHPGCRTILDIGGQDTKAISLDAGGRVGRFEMNDKCAAGTGRFLEVMAMALGCGVADFSKLAEPSEQPGAGMPTTSANGHKYSISSTCTVFAESEIVGLISRGKDRREVAGGIVDSVVSRVVSLGRRVGIAPDVVFVGGVAMSQAIRDELQGRLCTQVYVPHDPQVVAALGCALIGSLPKRIAADL